MFGKRVPGIARKGLVVSSTAYHSRLQSSTSSDKGFSLFCHKVIVLLLLLYGGDVGKQVEDAAPDSFRVPHDRAWSTSVRHARPPKLSVERGVCQLALAPSSMEDEVEDCCTWFCFGGKIVLRGEGGALLFTTPWYGGLVFS